MCNYKDENISVDLNISDKVDEMKGEVRLVILNNFQDKMDKLGIEPDQKDQLYNLLQKELDSIFLNDGFTDVLTDSLKLAIEDYFDNQGSIKDLFVGDGVKDIAQSAGDYYIHRLLMM